MMRVLPLMFPVDFLQLECLKVGIKEQGFRFVYKGLSVFFPFSKDVLVFKFKLQTIFKQYYSVFETESLFAI